MTDREEPELARFSRERLGRLIADRRSGRRDVDPASSDARPDAPDPDSGRRSSREAEAFVEGLDVSDLARREAGRGLAEIVQTGRYEGLIPDMPPDELVPELIAAAESEAGADLTGAADGRDADGLPADDEAYDAAAEAWHVADRRVARLHLRTGAIQLARAELETLAGIHALDPDGHLDLAESRWRSGDLAGAGDAIVEYLENGGDDALAYVIAAEASVAVGRVGDARRLARRALDRLTVPLEVVFAGQARSEVWPPPTDVEMQPASTLFTSLPPEAHRGGRIGLAGDAPPTGSMGRPLDSALTSGQVDAWGGGSATSLVDTMPLGLEEPVSAELEALVEAEEVAEALAEEATEAAESEAAELEAAESEAVGPANLEAPAVPAAPGVPAAPSLNATSELEGAKQAIADGDHAGAAIRLGLLLRSEPAMASAVLEVVGETGGGPAFDLLRGDAHRLAGDETAAREAFANALRWVEDASIESTESAPAAADAPPNESSIQLEAILDEAPTPDPNQTLLFEGGAPLPMEATEPSDELPAESADTPDADDPSPRRHRPGGSIRRPPTSRAPHHRTSDNPASRDPRSDQ